MPLFILERIVRYVPVPTIDQPTPDMGGPLTGLFSTLGGWILGLVLVAGGTVGVLGALLIIFGGIWRSSDMKHIGWRVVLYDAIGVAVAGSIGALLTLAQGLKVA